jgi:hypothetical protein
MKIPVLPPKEGKNKGSPEFIAKRMKQLQEFINIVCFHEELRVSQAFMSFIQVKTIDEFEKVKKEFAKVTNPNHAIHSSGVVKKLFTAKQPIKVDHFTNSEGKAKCAINSFLKSYAINLQALNAELLPRFVKYNPINAGARTAANS